MAKIFISYSSADRDFARELANNLRMLGHITWMDDEEIRWGESLINRTQQELRSASAVVALLSDASKSSQWVSFELGAATALGKKMFPVVLSNDPEVIPFHMTDIQHIEGKLSEVAAIAKAIHIALEKHV